MIWQWVQWAWSMVARFGRDVAYWIAEAIRRGGIWLPRRKGGSK